MPSTQRLADEAHRRAATPVPATFQYEDLHKTPTIPYHIGKVDRVLCMMGLGGCRERYTNGEAAWWTVSVALVSSGLPGTILVALGKIA